METRICAYGENSITFALEKNNGMMVNATEMAKALNENVESFLEDNSTKEFIKVCLDNQSSNNLNITSKDDLVNMRPNSGIWMHRILAIKFGAWLSPKIEIWIHSTIERILFGKHVERNNSFESTLLLINEKEEIEAKEDKTVEDFNRYLEIERLLKREKSKRTMLTRETVSGMKDLFD